MITDPISDLLTRLRNASAARKPEVVLPYSKIKHAIAAILETEGYVRKVEKIDAGVAGLKVVLKYFAGGGALHNLKRISKPGCRIYVDKDHLPKVQNNLGLAIISTSQGLMTNKDARQKGLGGEVICEIY